MSLLPCLGFHKYEIQEVFYGYEGKELKRVVDAIVIKCKECGKREYVPRKWNLK